MELSEKTLKTWSSIIIGTLSAIVVSVMTYTAFLMGIHPLVCILMVTFAVVSMVVLTFGDERLIVWYLFHAAFTVFIIVILVSLYMMVRSL